MSNLSSVQLEIRDVKQAMGASSSYLGMSGKMLQEYLMQLTEKESLFLAPQDSGTVSGYAVHAGGKSVDTRSTPALFCFGAKVVHPITAEAVFQVGRTYAVGGGGSDPVRMRKGESLGNDSAPVGNLDNGTLITIQEIGQTDPRRVKITAQQTPKQPEGWISLWLLDEQKTMIVVPTATFDRTDVASIMRFLAHPDIGVQDIIRSLKALGSLAYQAPAELGGNADVLSLVLALMRNHSDEAQLQIAAAHALGNMADDPAVAREKFSDAGMLSALVSAMVRIPAADVCKEVTETVARIVAAWEAQVSTILPIVLRVVAISQPGQNKVATRIILQLVQSELATFDDIARQLAAMMETAASDIHVYQSLQELAVQLSQSSPEVSRHCAIQSRQFPQRGQ